MYRKDAARNPSGCAVVLELAIEQQDRGEQHDGGDEADQRPAIIMIAEQCRPVAGAPGRMCSSTCRDETTARRDGRQQRHRVMAGARPEPDVEDRPHRQRCEQHALQQA